MRIAEEDGAGAFRAVYYPAAERFGLRAHGAQREKDDRASDARGMGHSR